MKCVRQDRSCFCYSLEHGAVIIGITFLISSGVALLAEIGMLVEWHDIQNNFKDERMRAFVHPFLIVAIALSSVYLIFSLLLLKGINKGNRHQVLPWILWSALYISIGIGCAIYELSLGGENLFEVTAVPVFYLIGFSLWIYSVWCIYDYFKSLKSQQNVDEENESKMIVKLHKAAKKESFRRAHPRPIWDSPLLRSYNDRKVTIV